MIDIEAQLGYTYSPIKGLSHSLADAPATAYVVRISGINRGIIPGSFILSTWITHNGKERLIGFHSTLSRWHVQGCANCQSHLLVTAFVPLYGLSKDQASMVKVKLHTRDNRKGSTGLKGQKPIHHVVGHLSGNV